MQPFDHLTVERDHAFLGISWRGEGGNNSPRLGQRLF
jgi:hypothetical protein